MADGLVGGISVNYKMESTTSESVYDVSDGTNFGEVEGMEKEATITTIIAPTIRYYLAESGAWVQAAYGFGSVTEKYEYDRDYPS